jgi:hypothetical protein
MTAIQVCETRSYWDRNLAGGNLVSRATHAGRYVGSASCPLARCFDFFHCVVNQNGGAPHLNLVPG